MTLVQSLLVFGILGICLCLFVYLTNRAVLEAIKRIDNSEKAVREKLKNEIKEEILNELKEK